MLLLDDRIKWYFSNSMILLRPFRCCMLSTTSKGCSIAYLLIMYLPGVSNSGLIAILFALWWLVRSSCMHSVSKWWLYDCLSCRVSRCRLSTVPSPDQRNSDGLRIICTMKLFPIVTLGISNTWCTRLSPLPSKYTGLKKKLRIAISRKVAIAEKKYWYILRKQILQIFW